MALPSTISGVWSAHRNNRQGPFLIGGNLYVITWDSSAHVLRAYKSTDGGDTWTEQDSAHAPATYASNETYDCVLDGATIHVAYDDSSGTIRLVTFASDAWGTPTAAGPTDANSVSSVPAKFVCVRANGDRVVLYQSVSQTLMGNPRRRFCAVIYTSSWGTPFGFTSAGVGQASFGLGVKDQYDLRAAILGASDRVHVFYTKYGTTDHVYHQSFTAGSAGGADNEGTVSTNFTGSQNNYPVGLPVAFANGGNTEIAIPHESNTVVYVARCNSGANPSFTDTAASDNSGLETSANLGAIAVDGTTKYLLYVDLTSQDLYRDSDGGTNTWGTDAAQEASITCQGVNAAKVTNAIGILFNDNGTVKYDQYALTPPATSLALGGFERRTARRRLLNRI